MKKILIIAVILIIGGAFGWYTISPLFIDEVVDEELVFDKNVRAVQNQDEQKSPEKVLREGETITQTTKNNPAGSTSTSATSTPVADLQESESVPVPAPTGPVVLADGIFEGSDAFHKSSGEVYMVQTEDGNVLRFENFNVTNGPDLRVLLSTNANPTRGNLGDYIEVEKLKGNIGNQNYELSDSIDVSIYKSVVIYCDPFHIVFASAPLN